ncbi:MAG: hypothetical protein HKP58_09380, partial [Desulfatitalea sp.]|nr:hypothetical protein [Desulfatitalea sp.]NNK00613.1 hypothetical protein [Desulfatitalea sp.]
MHDGTAQNRRHPAPLQPGYFNVAEMDLNTLLAMGVDYAGLVNYYNSDNCLDGNWTRIFTGDATMVLAHISATGMNRIEADFLAACRQPAHLRPWAAVAQASYSYRLAVKLDNWHAWLMHAPCKPGIAVREVIARVIRNQLAGHLHRLTALVGQYPIRFLEQHGIDVNAFAPIWTFPSPTSPMASGAHDGQAVRRGSPQVHGLLQSCFHAFHKATRLVIETAASHFTQSLARRDHEPSIALYIAFIQLFRSAQQHINTFVPRHRDYYYRDILQMLPAPPTPDTTFLVVALDGSLPDVSIPRGTEFTAGNDSGGKALIYRADNDLWVTDTAVEELHTLYFEKNPLISPEKELGHVTGAWMAAVPPLDFKTAPAGKDRAPYPFFGAATEQAKEESGAAARFGMAIADPILLLGQGKRRITLGIGFDAAPEHHPAAIVRRISDLTATTPQDAFYKVFKRMFSIALTADTGWYEIEDYLPDAALIDAGSDNNRLCLQIHLATEAPPIVAYDPRLHGGRFGHKSPMVRLCINDQNNLYPYSLLRRLTLKEIRIEVEVEGVKDLLVYNHHGRLDPAGPFHPFGPLPDIGSYLMVGSYEAALKRLSAWEICLEWDTLPGGRQGMQQYYRHYDEPYLPGLYRVHATLLGSGRWHPVKRSEQVAVSLFQTQHNADDGSIAIAPRSLLKV